MKRLLLPMASLVALVVVACGGQGDPDTSATDGGAWAVLDTNRSEQDASVPMDVVAVQDANDGVLELDGASQDTGVEVVEAPGDVALDSEDSSVVSDAARAEPDASQVESWGGGVLLYEVASDFLNVAGAGARFTELAADGELVEEGTEQWGPCAASISEPDAPEVVEFGFDAGLITVAGTSSEVTLTPVDEDADGVGYASNLSEDLESLLPAGGALLTVVGAGGTDIEAFELVVQVPEPVIVSSPGIGLFQSASTSQDLNVSWNAGTGEAILVTATPLDQAFQTASGLGLICGADEDTGNLVIPAAAMAAMKDSGVSRVALAVTRLRVGTALAGDRTVTTTVSRSTGGPLDLK